MLKIHLIFVAKIIWIIMGYAAITLKIVIVSILDTLKALLIMLFVVALFSFAFTDIETLKIIASAPIDEWQIVLQIVLKIYLSATVILTFLFQVLDRKYVGDFQLSEVWKEYLNNKKQYQNT